MIHADLKKLLAQCKVSPTEDAPRLDLAAWLCHNNDEERGEFVRAQLLTATPTNRTNNWYRGRPAHEAIESRLLKKNIGKWLNGLLRSRYFIQFDDITEDEAIKLPSAKFERGMVTISLSSLKEIPYFLDRLPEDSIPWLECLNTGVLDDENFPRDVQGLDLLRTFSSVAFTCPDGGKLAPVDWLNDARIRRLTIGEIGKGPTLDRISTFSALRPHRMWISPNPKNRSGWEGIMSSPVLENLRSLECGINNETYAIATLANSRHLRQLDHLYLSGNNFPNDSLRSLFNSPAMSRLTSLHVSGYSGQLHGVTDALASSESMCCLRALNLGFNAIQSEELIKLARSQVVENLRSLSLSSGEATDKGIQALADSAGLSQLESLDLSCAGEGDQGALAIVQSPNMAKLRHLSLCRCEITDKTVRALAASKYLAEIEELDLSLNPLSDRAMDAIAASTELRNLRYIRAEDIAINIGTFERLMSSSVIQNLEGLAIRSQWFGPEHIKILAESPMLANLKKLVLAAPGLGRGEAMALMDAPWF